MGGRSRSARTCYVAQDKHGNKIMMSGLPQIDILPLQEEFLLADGPPLKPGMMVWYPFEGQWAHGGHRGVMILLRHLREWGVDLPGATPPLSQVYSSRPEIYAPLPCRPGIWMR